MILTDYHVHSEFSDDASTPVETLVRRAVTLGLTELAVTDHQDYRTGGPSAGVSFELPRYFAALNRLRARYAGQIRLVFGIEIGLMHTQAREIENMLAGQPFDFVIGSSHDAPRAPYYLSGYFDGKSKHDAFQEYFEQTLLNIRSTDGFDVYGHLDYISRYGVYPDNSLAYTDYRDIIDEILKELIAHGKGIEVNTSGFRYGLDTVNPQLAILKRYRALGGEIITVGSDAHKTTQVGAYLDRAEAALKESGFKAYTLFRERKPIWKDL